MAFGVLSAVSGNRIEIRNPDVVAVSYPGFWEDLKRVAV
jgi:5-enolpyruvylshikimate-3-phosphate synthase